MRRKRKGAKPCEYDISSLKRPYSALIKIYLIQSPCRGYVLPTTSPKLKVPGLLTAARGRDARREEGREPAGGGSHVVLGIRVVALALVGDIPWWVPKRCGGPWTPTC